MLSGRLALRCVQQAKYYRRFSTAPTPTEEKKSEPVEYAKPQHATRQSYEKTRNEHRFKSATDGSGVVPTGWQKRFLVWTRIYPSSKDIPEYVSQSTMNRMHDRMRVLFIIVGIFGFFTIFYAVEAVNARRIARDRDAGVVVTKM